MPYVTSVGPRHNINAVCHNLRRILIWCRPHRAPLPNTLSQPKTSIQTQALLLTTRCTVDQWLKRSVDALSPSTLLYLHYVHSPPPYVYTIHPSMCILCMYSKAENPKERKGKERKIGEKERKKQKADTQKKLHLSTVRDVNQFKRKKITTAQLPPATVVAAPLSSLPVFDPTGCEAEGGQTCSTASRGGAASCSGNMPEHQQWNMQCPASWLA